MPEAKEDKKGSKKEDRKEIGITIKKEDEFGDWFSQVITKAELVDYTDVSGCYVFRPNSYSIWEKVQAFMDHEFKKLGVKNAYFPLFIPEKLLNKEKQHVEGFTPEVAWVTHAGDSKLAERLAVRPTSETIMYDSYKKWIKSWRDLPLKINQWCNVVRWEFKNPVPFIRSREFLWQEGHTAHRTKEDAEKEVFEILDIYEKTYSDLYAMPCIKGYKSEKEKFAGALYTTTIEIFMPNGKSAQACTSHCLGQNFSKAFDISFLDEKEQKQFVWQNSWGFTTRSIGIMVGMHSDNKGLVLPPRVAAVQAVIVPITFADSKEKVMGKCREAEEKLISAGVSVFLDERDEYTPGWKFNEWEMKGIPLRVEIGPKDVEKEQAVVVRRDSGKKEFIKITDLGKKAKDELEQMHKDLLDKALKLREDNTVEAKDFGELMKGILGKKLVRASWCSNEECEDQIKDKTGGAKILCIPFGEKKMMKSAKGKCVCCGKSAKYEVYIAKSY